MYTPCSCIIGKHRHAGSVQPHLSKHKAKTNVTRRLHPRVRIVCKTPQHRTLILCQHPYASDSTSDLESSRPGNIMSRLLNCASSAPRDVQSPVRVGNAQSQRYVVSSNRPRNAHHTIGTVACRAVCAPAPSSFLQESSKIRREDAEFLDPERPFRVLIAGGGIAGLVLAIALLKKGVDVRVFEKGSTAIRGEGEYRGPIQARHCCLRHPITRFRDPVTSPLRSRT